MTTQRDDHGNVRTIPDLEREQLIGYVQTSERGAINVSVGWVGEQRAVRLQAFRRRDDGQWEYQGRAVVVPVEKVGELRALLEKAGD